MVSAKATTPSRLVDSVSSHVSQPTAMRCIQRPVIEVDWPILGKLEGPQAGVLYGAILVVIIYFMPGGIVYGLRQLRSKFLVLVPRLPAPRESAAPVIATEVLPPGELDDAEEPADVAVASVQQTTRERYQ